MAVHGDLVRTVTERLRTNPTEVDVVEYTTELRGRAAQLRVPHRAPRQRRAGRGRP